MIIKPDLDINEIEPEKLFLSHQKKFQSFNSDIQEIYKNNPNRDKIITLLDYWVFNIYCLKKFYGKL